MHIFGSILTLALLSILLCLVVSAAYVIFVDGHRVLGSVWQWIIVISLVLYAAFCVVGAIVVLSSIVTTLSG